MMAHSSTTISPSEEIRFSGVPASPGVVVGPVIVLVADEKLIRKRRIRPDDIGAEISKLEEALFATRTQINALKEKLSAELGEQDAAIFDAHLLVVEDPTIIEAVKSQMHERLLGVDYLYQEVTRSLARQMREIPDEFLRERANDIVDVSRRVIRNLQGQGITVHQLDVPSILVAHDLTPSDTAQIDRKMILGFATEVGSRTSHTAIMARSLNIPAVVGLKSLLSHVENGQEVLIDGHEGTFIARPHPQTKFVYGQMEVKRHAVDESLDSIRDLQAITTDSRRITVSANVGLSDDIPMLKDNGAEGAGLYRTEFLFLNRDTPPDEDEQVAAYRLMAQACKPHSIIIRTLDLGGDKIASGSEIEPEQNPFLGWRGIRYCLDRPELFKTQLRAICRASTEGNIRLMFPMITDLSELKRAKALLEESKQELLEKQIPFAEKIECGMMIEVPSTAMTADILAKEVDFFSIGTNDLIQYTLAVDRVNERVANLYQPTHPAILRLIHRIVEAAHQANIWVGVCGEMAGDIYLTPMLIGLGVDELSLGSVFVPRIKKAIRTLNYVETQTLAQELMQCGDTMLIAARLDEYARRLYPELL